MTGNATFATSISELYLLERTLNFEVCVIDRITLQEPRVSITSYHASQSGALDQHEQSAADSTLLAACISLSRGVLGTLPWSNRPKVAASP